MSTDIERLLQEVRSLAPEEKRRVRQALDDPALTPSSEARSAEEEFKQRLLRSGLLERIKPRIVDSTKYEGRKPFEIAGKPVSQSVIEERR